MIDISCQKCHTLYHCEESHIGKHLRCAGCGVHVPILRANRAVVQQSPACAAAPCRGPSAASVTPTARGVKRIGKFAIVSVVAAIAVVALVVRQHHILSEHRDANLSGVIKAVPQDTAANGRWDVADETPSVAREPQTHIAEPKPTEPDESKPASYNSLPTGARIEEDVGANGYGELTVDNGTAEDAVARLSGTGDDTLRWFFVKAHSAAHVAQIPKGTYRLTFTTGLNWVESEETFSWHPSYTEFERPFEFDEQRNSEGVQYHRISVTLHPVAFGNIRTRPITREEFLRGHRTLARQRP
jgi:hypothetical protein